MARLAKLEKGQWDQFDRMVSGTVSAEEISKLVQHPDVWGMMLEQMRQHPAFKLIHGLFTPLADKLELVRSWPGVTAEQIARAVQEFEISARKRRYEAAVEKHELLDVVVTVYRASVPETLIYARGRMHDAFGGKYDEWKDAYGKGDVDDNRVRLFKGVPEHCNCVRIEVVDLGAHFNPKDGFIPKDVRGPNSATFAVIYAAAENPPWVLQMDGSNVPFALVGGLELNVPDFGEWTGMPLVWRCGGEAYLGGGRCGGRCHEGSMPVLWE